MVNFSHVIFYVKDIQKALLFYKEAFDITPKFVHESGQYAELNTGETSIAFASEELGNYNLSQGYLPHDVKQVPLACEIVFTTEDVAKTYKSAIESGALSVAAPQEKPWGQITAYLRDPNGVLIEIASQIE